MRHLDVECPEALSAARPRGASRPVSAKPRPFAAGAPWLACGLAIAALAPATGGVARADNWTPGVSFGTRFDDHRTPFDPPQDFQAGMVAPQLGFDAGSGASMLKLFARRQYEWAPGSTLGGATFAAAPATDVGSLRARRTWASAGSVAIDGRYARSHDVLNVDDRSALAGSADAAYWTGSATGGVGRLEGDYRIRGWSYETPGLEDAVAMSWSATALPVVGQDDAWLVGWRQRQLQLGSTVEVRQHLPFVGFRRRLSPMLTGQIEVGPSDVQFADGTRWFGPAFSVALVGPRDDEGRLTTELRIQRDFVTSVTADVSRALGSGRVTARGESLMDVEGGIYRDPNFTRRLAIGVQDTTLSRSTVLGMELSYARTRPLRLGAPEADLLRASGWAVRRLRPWLTGKTVYSYLRQPGFGHRGATDFRRIRLEASMTVVL